MLCPCTVSAGPAGAICGDLLRARGGPRDCDSFSILERVSSTNLLRGKQYLSLDELDGARCDQDGNVDLRDGRSVHAVSFDIVPLSRDFSDLEHAIVLLAIRFSGSRGDCIRQCPETGVRGIDYSTVPQLVVNNVKDLARYIDANIGELLDASGKPLQTHVPLRQIHRTLDVAGIRKSRGRRRRPLRKARAAN